MSPVFGSAVPALLTEQVRPRQLWMNVGTGAALPLGSTIVTDCAAVVAETCPLVPHRERHRERCAHRARSGEGPGRERAAPLTVVPVDVPKFHVYTSDAAFSSVEARPSKVQTFWLQV